MAEKIITVVGATGAQGGGLVRAIQADPNGGFRARAITRDVNSDKAKALAALGAEVVQGDVDDQASLDRAFQGAHGAFCVTFFWDHLSAEREGEEALRMATAAKRGGVKHAIWSTFEDTRKKVPLSDTRMPTLMGRYKVPHFDGKADADHHFTDAGVPTTFLLTCFYWENYIYFGSGPQRGEDGKLYLTYPMGDKPIPGISSEDIGRCSYGIFKRGAEFANKYVGVAGGHETGEEMAAKLSRAIGEDVKWNPVPPDVYRSFGFPGADELGNMFQYEHDFSAEFAGIRDLKLCRELNPQLQTLDQWLTVNGSKIPIK